MVRRRGCRVRIAFAIPGDLSLPTGGYEYARRLLAEWPGMGIGAEVIPLPASFPHPSAAELDETLALLRGAEGALLIDGLAYGAFSGEVAEAIGPRAVVLLHHPLCDETGLSGAEALRLMATEKAALAFARGVVCTSPATARALKARFGIADPVVAIPGTDPAPQAALTGSPPVLLAVGTVTRRKGYDVLIEALAACRDLDWRCGIAGATDRDPAETERLATMIAGRDLGDRIALLGEVGNLRGAYLGADLFVAPSRHEGYGMAVVEAMAHGLPVVAAAAGALPETAPCAVLVPPEQPGALAEALTGLLADAAARRKLGAECRGFAAGLPDWRETARIVADTLRRAA